MDFTVQTNHRVEIKEREKSIQILGPCLRTRKTMEPMRDFDANFSWCAWNGLQMFGKESGTVGNWSTSETIQTTVL